MWLSNALIADVEKHGARVFYVSYAACRRWAEHRATGEPLVFSGWYWALGEREAGPYKSQSAAWRDAWYTLGRKRAPKMAAHNDEFERGRNVAANKARARRKPRLRVVA